MPRRLWPICLGLVTLCLSVVPALAQARYDGEDPDERFSIRLGGFSQRDTESTIRFDSTTLGIGTIIQLEDKLKVDDETSTVRLDGFYRFNPRHRLDWAWYATEREGSVVVTEEFQIGDEIFEVGDGVDTKWKSGIFKVGWNWSFINVKKYEFWLGAGFNIRDLELTFVNSLGSQFDEEAEDAALPLPVFNFGGRYNFTGKSQLNWKYEIFALEYGDYDGRFQEVALLFEHNTFEHFGFGGGMSSFLFDLSVEDDDFRGEVETSHTGLMAYFKAYF